MGTDGIAERIQLVRERISEAASRSGRDASQVRLCAVSKFHPAEDVRKAMAAGQTLFGENRVQEACAKFQNLGPCELHIIGSLQRNKVRKAVLVASCIQSVDRPEVLEDIERHAAALGKRISVMLEVHTGEDSKAGIATESELLRLCERLAAGEFRHVEASGLMTMAPFSTDEKLVRSSFQKLRSLKELVRSSFPDLPVTELSMGMSGDFLWAIEEGSTMVRIGTAIFGEREYPA